MATECERCGREFDTDRAKNIHQSRGCNKPFHDAEELHRLYHGDGLSAEQIADRFDVTPTTIYNYLRDHGIELKDDKADPTRPPHHRFREYSDRPLGTCCETVATTIDGTMHEVRIHRLVAYAHRELSTGEFWNRNVIVHHKSQHGWDNRPSNLEAMPKSEHRAAHAE